MSALCGASWSRSTGERGRCVAGVVSIRLMTAVFDHSRSRLADRLVLLVIADRSDDDGTGCFRGRESIAHMAGVSVRQVTDSIRHLVELGELDVTTRSGKSHLYRVTLADSARVTPAESARPPSKGCQTPGHTGTRDTSSDTSSYPGPKKQSVQEEIGYSNDPLIRAEQARRKIRDHNDRTVELHQPTDEERARVRAGPLGDARARLGLSERKEPDGEAPVS